MDSTKVWKNIWLALAIIIAVLMPIYGAWHHWLTLLICIGMYFAFRGEGTEEAEGGGDSTD